MHVSLTTWKRPSPAAPHARRWFGWMVCLGLGAGVVLSGVSADAALVRFKRTAIVEAPMITLGDIAEVLHNDPDIAARLRSMTVAPAPAPGRQLQLDFAAVRGRIGAKGFNLTELEFDGPSEIVVAGAQKTGERKPTERPLPAARHSESQKKTVETAVAAAVAKAVQRRYPDLGRVSATAQVRAAQLAQLLSVNLDGFEADPGRPPFQDSQLFEIRFTDRQGNPQVAQVQCEVNQHPRMLTVHAIVAKGQVIQADDLAWRQLNPAMLDSSTPTASIVSKPELIIGKEAVRTLRPDEPLTLADVKEVPLIRAGDVVTVYSRCGGIVVRMEAKARSAGGLGDTVHLATFDGKEKLRARVIRYHEAEVLPAEVAPASATSNSAIRFVPATEGKSP